MDYFVSGHGDATFLDFVELAATAAEGHTPESVAACDYIECSGGVPLFSVRFVQGVGAVLRDEVVFFPCIVECQGRRFPFHAGQTLSVRALADPTHSSFHELTDGTRILERGVYPPKDTRDFFLAREQLDPSRLLASRKLKDLVTALGLRVRFLPPV